MNPDLLWTCCPKMYGHGRMRAVSMWRIPRKVFMKRIHCIPMNMRDIRSGPLCDCAPNLVSVCNFLVANRHSRNQERKTISLELVMVLSLQT